MDNLVGQQRGNYRLLQLLGRGGFAEVYLGEHVHLERHAAIKILHANLSETDVSAFKQEAKLIADLDHPHIISVLDFAVQENQPFLVMEYAPNGSLRQRHPRGSRLPLPLVLNYVQQVSSALQYAHDHKLIHRDVKPENMLINEQGEILLSDFGIATIAHSTSSMSTQGSMGTVPYMAPEQIQEHPRLASDQYALGVVVYQWLCGELPFQGLASEIAIKHLTIPAPPLRTKVPDIPTGVEQVVMTALAKDPKARFESVQAFAVVLEQAYTQKAAQLSKHVLQVQLSSTELAVQQSAKEGTTLSTLLSQPPLPTKPEREPLEVSAIAPDLAPQQIQPTAGFLFKHSLQFGLLLIAASIIFPAVTTFIPLIGSDRGALIAFLVDLSINFYAGWSTARKTGRVDMAMLIGLLATLWPVLLLAIFVGVVIAITATGTFSIVLASCLAAALISVSIGAGMGWLGGMFGRRRGL